MEDKIFTSSSISLSLTSASSVKNDNPSAAQRRRSSSFPGFIKNRRQASASLVELPSANGRKLASCPPLAPSLQSPTNARTLTKYRINNQRRRRHEQSCSGFFLKGTFFKSMLYGRGRVFRIKNRTSEWKLSYNSFCLKPSTTNWY